jgi:ribonuclease T1
MQKRIKRHSILLLVAVVLLVAGCSPTITPTPDTASGIKCDRPLTGGRNERVPTIGINDLVRCRPEARTTLDAIKANGPFRFRQDDATFQNREGYLSDAPSGTYREYTVVTPDENDRGSRRFVTAGVHTRRPANYDNLYYSDDHYETFWLVKER